MSESPAATMPAVDVPPTAHAELPHQLFTESDENNIDSPADNAKHKTTMSKPGSGLALFSTELGTRLPRNLKGPPFPPIIVRSNKVAGVVDTALFLRKKFGHISWTIFPQCGWTIEDFWDAEDIHVDTREHCTEVLKFLSQDNFWCARRFAEDWSRANPEQVVKTVGLTDMKSIYDSNDPLAVVDKIFVNGEMADKPREFLWHAAHIMRTTLVEIRTEQQRATVNDHTPQRTPAERQLGITKSSSVTEINLDDPAMAEASFAQPDVPINKTSRSSSATTKQVSAPFVLRSASDQHGPLPVVKRAPAHNPPQPGAYFGQPTGHVVGVMPGQTMMSPAMSISNLRNPKGRPSPGGPYNQPMPPGAYGENLPRVPSGAYSSRPTSGTITVMHSPHFDSASMAMGPPVMAYSHPVPLHGQCYPPVSPSAYSAQHYHPDLAHAGMTHPHLVHTSSTPMAPNYVNQTSDCQRPRGTSMGDLTNNQYFPNSILSHNMDNRGPTRQNSFYSSGANLLYDPYGGSKPAFSDLYTGRRAVRGGGSMEQPGRSRKLLNAGNRPRTASYGNQWAEQVPGTGNRYPSRVNMVDDPNIVGDRVQGCDQTWIGPENQSVNELFVSDLPDDVKQDEVRSMFFRGVNITPTRVTVKYNATGYHPHAFVLFSTASDAKLGMRVGASDPMIRGVPVRITVPRRFYQKNEDYRHQHDVNQAASKQSEERASRRVTRMSSHEEEAVPTNTEVQTAHVYSPQDARSDLQKKTSPQALSTDSTAGCSPKVQNSKTSRVSTTGNLVAEPTDTAEVGDMKDTTVDPLISESKVATKDEPATMTVQSDILSIEKQIDVPAFTPASTVGSLPVLPTGSLSAIDDSVTTVKKSLLKFTPPKQALNTGHNRVESQTQAILQNNDAAGMVAKLSDLPKDPVPEIVEAKRGEITETLSSSVPHHEREADGEQGANSSFLSAQEVIAKVDSTLAAGAESQLLDQGTKAPENFAPAQTSTKASVRPLPSMTPEVPQEPAFIDSNILDHEVSATIPVQVTNNKEAPATTDSADDPIMATNLPQPPVVAVKKHGPQQTPSINPFGITKAQRQKEKEQKRKEKRREQEEKAAKTKAEKVGPSAVPRVTTTLTAKSDTERQTAIIASPQSEVLAKSSAASKYVAEQVNLLPNSIKGKGKVKVKASVPDPTYHALQIGSEEEISGKQTGGNTTKFPNAVTHKAKVAQKSIPSTTEEKFSRASALLSLALSPEHNSTLAPDSLKIVEYHTTASESDSLNATDRPKMRKTVPIVPNLSLSLNLNLPPARSTTIQPGTSTTTPPPCPAATNLIAPPLSMSQTMYDSDVVSVASSDTLHPNYNTEPSPSPTAQDFYTPLQTPAMPSTSQDPTPKPKKKKNKKKKKPVTVLNATGCASPTAFADPGLEKASSEFAVARNTGSSIDELFQWTSDPFGNQMLHIDAIRAATKEPDNIFNQINREREEKAAKEKDTTGIDSEKFRHIQGFLMENPHLYKA